MKKNSNNMENNYGHYSMKNYENIISVAFKTCENIFGNGWMCYQGYL